MKVKQDNTKQKQIEAPTYYPSHRISAGNMANSQQVNQTTHYTSIGFGGYSKRLGPELPDNCAQAQKSNR
jgi:hypothetical protein